MNYPRSEYDFGTAAIRLCFFSLADHPATLTVADRRRSRIERSHSARPDRAELVKALRWVFTRYPQHFSVMR
jgi:hypothetical protein